MVFLAVLAVLSHAIASRTTVELTLASGTIRGDVVTKDGITINRFRGVKYGKDTSNPRWISPQPVEPWSGVKDALEYGASCPQPNDAFSVLSKLSEDCLGLNVWIPAKPDVTGPLPVMLFFYGGSWYEGSAMFPLYSGEPTAELTRNTIVVTANYRLGPFGFLGSDKLRSAATGNSTGNLGLQDQRLAMQWVHSNAQALGADKTRVMIFGESAGAGSVACHLVIPKSWPFFSRAAMESGPWAGWSAKSLLQAEAQFDALSQNLNCSKSADPVSCMQQIGFKTILDNLHNIPGGIFTDWSPVIDSVELTSHPMLLGAAGKSNPVPILLGSNHDEGTLLAPIKPSADQTDLDAMLTRYFAVEGNPDLVAEVRSEYNVSSFKAHKDATAAFWAGIEVCTDYAMACAARRTAAFQSMKTNQVFLYQFTHELAIIDVVEAIAKQPFGVFHGSELPFVFNSFQFLLGKEEEQLSRTFVQYWASFAATGNPNPPNSSLPHWPPYTKAGDHSLRLDLDVSVVQGLKKQRCDFWDSLFPLLPPSSP